MAVVNVTSWEEFVAAVAVSGNEVECPTEVWDLAEQGIFNVQPIRIQCTSINGNGLVIRNANFSEGGAPNYGSGSGALVITGSSQAKTISGLHFENAVTNSALIAYNDTGYGAKGATVERCSFSGLVGSMVVNDTAYSQLTCRRCSFVCCSPKGYFVGYRYQGASPYFSYCDILYFGKSFTNPAVSSSNLSLGLYANRVRVQGSLGEKAGVDGNSVQVVINGKCGEAVLGSSGVVVNTDLCEDVSGATSAVSSAIPVTSEQLADEAYLAAAGFPIGEGKYWHEDGEGVPTHTYFPALPAFADKPFPLAVWQHDPRKNNGFPFNSLLRGVPSIQIADPVEERPYITIYDKNTKQEEFDNNGLAVLCPTRCEITETINSKWAIDMQHPIDPDDKWRHIQPSNLIKALGQLFTLRKISHTWRGNSGSVQASGDHVFYQQNDGWVFPGARITGQTGLEVLNAINTQTERFAPGITMYNWSYDSDVVVPAGVDYSEWCPTREGATPIEYIMGSNGLIAMTGGELYRDNFYYSVKQRMENAKDNAFEIRIGKNLKGITRVVDFSSFCVFFRAYDQYGQSFGISWTGEYAYQFVPHTIIRSKNFNTYVDESTLPEGGDIYARSFELLEAEGTAFFEANCAPIVSYKVDIEDVKGNPDYKMFANLDDLKVGNTGRLYDERLGVDMGLKISQTKTDAITGKVLEVTFGTVQSFTGGQNYPAVLTDLIPEVVDVEIPLRDVTGERLYDVNNEPLYEGGEV